MIRHSQQSRWNKNRFADVTYASWRCDYIADDGAASTAWEATMKRLPYLRVVGSSTEDDDWEGVDRHNEELPLIYGEGPDWQFFGAILRYQLYGAVIGSIAIIFIGALVLVYPLAG